MGNEFYNDEDDGPLTWRQLALIVALGLGSWVVIGIAFYGAFRLAEAMR